MQDSGIGISKESLPHLFEKFYRVHNKEEKVSGTGLGLSICKEIIQGHGGWIDVQSELGVGTVFLVHIPRNAKVRL